jgi:4-amino-4-deoxy-L-arabinose transferase-like glycosyltransferase
VYESSAPRGGGVPIAAALMIVVAAVGLVARPLLAIDETRYAAVALEMMRRNDWLVPHLNHAAYSHKPPLLFWLVLLGWKVFGVSELWARLVSPICALVALMQVSAVARMLWPHDARTRGWAPVITVSALVWAATGSLLMFDTLLTCASLLAIIGVLYSVESGKRRGVAYIAAGIALGILAKGPVIVLHVLPVALAAPWWATPRDDRRWHRWYLTLSGAIALGVCGALLWAVPAGYRGGPEYQLAIFLGQTAGRLTNSFAHQRPFWWYLPLLPAMLFPWVLWPEAWRALNALRNAPRDRGIRFCLVWSLAALLGFSFISGKQVHYLVPLVPAWALLLSRGLSLREAAPLARPWLVALLLGVLGGTVILAGTTTLADRALWWPHPPVVWPWATVPLIAAVVLVAWQRGRSTRNMAVHSLAFSAAVTLCALQLAAAPALSVPYNTARMSAQVRQAMEAGHRVAMVGKYNGEYDFAGRLYRTPIDSVTPVQAPSWLRVHPHGLLLTYERGRTRPAADSILAQFPFRNGWATLSTALPHAPALPR